MKTTDHPVLDTFEEFMGKPLDRFFHDCHSASLAVVRSGLFETARVVRGLAPDLTQSQHSWVILSEDPFDLGATIVDPTAWSYEGVDPYIWFGTYRDGVHLAHGAGYRHDFSDLPSTDDPEKVIELNEENLHQDAWEFYNENLRGLGVLGWLNLFHGGMQGWPAGEIMKEAYLDSRLHALLPIDLVGTLTDLNPGGLYR